MIDFAYLRNDIIGQAFRFDTPFGKRLMTYADYTASGRAVKCIEKYIIHLLRSYANTHTEDDVTGKNMTKILHRAEAAIKHCLHAQDTCYVIANGTGATGAIAKLLEVLGLYLPPATRQRLDAAKQALANGSPRAKDLVPELERYEQQQRPVVFISPYEHHSNDIMWRESLADVVTIGLTGQGMLDLADLERKLSLPAHRERFKIGSFSAASNVTGVISPVYAIARIMHAHQGIACFDFAASAPYVDIDMSRPGGEHLDAVFLSPHKFLGGPQASGILVLNKKLYDNSLAPTFAGGGTVDYVSAFAYDFSRDVETREKPGTPGVFQIIRAALCLELKRAIGIPRIEAREKRFIHRVFDRLDGYPNIRILGPRDPEQRIAIFSLLIKHRDRYLHPKLGTALLNDLFGIQSRAGCSCAGPYGHYLLDIDREQSDVFRRSIAAGYGSLKPGWLRVNFHYTFTDQDVDFICDAIRFVADHGARFIPLYEMDLHTGMWSHREFTPPRSLDDTFSLENILRLESDDCFKEESIDRPPLYETYLQEARALADTLPTTAEYAPFPDARYRSLCSFYCSHYKA